MICKDFQGLKLSQLGFGTMRLPLREDRSIDEEQAAAMTAEAIAKGVNYFDTAWPYHGGKSETVIGEILKQYPRESFYLADKFPGHQIAPSYDVKAVFEHQLEKCGVGYFDFYLLHNVYENSIAVYEDERWGILPYLLEQKKKRTYPPSWLLDPRRRARAGGISGKAHRRDGVLSNRTELSRLDAAAGKGEMRTAEPV